MIERRTKGGKRYIEISNGDESIIKDHKIYIIDGIKAIAPDDCKHEWSDVIIGDKNMKCCKKCICQVYSNELATVK